VIAALLIFAAAATPAGAPALLDEILVEVSGRNTTSPDSVRRMMNTQEGSLLDRKQLENDLLRLRATGVLYDVSAEEGEEGQRLTVRVHDRWSLVPLFGLRRGGGRTNAKLGIVDRNFLGRLVQLSAEATSASDIPFSSVRSLGSYIWFYIPRIAGSRLSTGVYWQREFLDLSGWNEVGDRIRTFDRNRHLVRAEGRYELRDLVTAAIVSQVFNDSYAFNQTSPFPTALPPRGRTATLGLELAIGLMDDRVISMEGTELKITIDGARAGLVSDFSFVMATASLRSFYIPGPRHNLGGQIAAQLTTARDDSHLFRAGGLLEIRGFPDAYFLGQRMLRGNLEYRFDLQHLTVLVPMMLQLVAFVDGGLVDGRADAIGGFRYQGPFVSTGVGARIVVIPVTRAVLRADLATGLWPRNTIDFSVGGQQFF